MDFRIGDEERLIYDQIKQFAEAEIAPRVREHDLEARFDHESWRKLGEIGLLGMHLPEDYGGSAASVLATVLAGEALGHAGVDGGLCLAYGAHSFLCADTILVHGSEAQKARHLPRLASGEAIGCMGLTEPGAGSDVAALRTRAERVPEGWRLNGSKIFITNGSISDLAVVYAKSDPSAGHAGISAFIVERGTPGFSAAQDMHKLGMRTSHTSELVFDDCVIPEENLLGMEGAGFFMAMQTVEWDRSALLAPMIGQMQFAIERSCRYATERQQFGRPIAAFDAIKEKIASMKVFMEAARALVYRIAWCKDQGQAVSHLEAAVAKLFLGDWSLGPTNDAILLHGGYGYTAEYDVERVFRDGRLAAIGGGTSDIQKMIISKLMDGSV